MIAAIELDLESHLTEEAESCDLVAVQAAFYIREDKTLGGRYAKYEPVLDEEKDWLLFSTDSKQKISLDKLSEKERQLVNRRVWERACEVANCFPNYKEDRCRR